MTEEEARAAVDKAIEMLDTQLPELLPSGELTRVIGSLITAYTTSMDDAMVAIRDVAQAVGEYYAPMCQCPKCVAARRKLN